ncbi:hypothetical protein HA149_06310, partial [Prochlorococcus marinus XMU1406]|uniref:hypothetical protein n=1 Tax=Prochlorococcus marinus TaxID=1219 RepID=UPI001ADC9330
NEVWTTNANGIHTSHTGWITDAQAVAEGYENTFTKDFNNDGLISGGSYYQLLGDNGAVTLKYRSSHSGWNDDTSNHWNVIAAKNNSSSFQVLFDGTAKNEGLNEVWTTNANGIHTSHTGWMTDAQAVAEGYESIFNLDINNNGSIGI